MGVAWGIVLIVLGLLAWLGQTISWFAPVTAERLTLTESEDNVEAAYYGDIRSEALWDTLTLWSMVAAGGLLVVDKHAWAYFGLISGGMYLYFAGRGIITRAFLAHRGFRIGTPQNVATAYVLLTVWAVAAVITIVAAIVALPTT